MGWMKARQIRPEQIISAKCLNHRRAIGDVRNSSSVEIALLLFNHPRRLWDLSKVLLRMECSPLKELPGAYFEPHKEVTF